MEESKEELEPLDESESGWLKSAKAGLKLNIQKN